MCDVPGRAQVHIDVDVSVHLLLKAFTCSVLGVSVCLQDTFKLYQHSFFVVFRFGRGLVAIITRKGARSCRRLWQSLSLPTTEKTKV